MERKKTRPLTLEEAKFRFRLISHTTALSIIQQHPKESTLGALVLGLILGATPTARGKVMGILLKLVSF